LVFPGLSVLDLGPMYATTDRRQTSLLTAVCASGSCSGGRGNVLAVETAAALPSVRPREPLRRPRGRRGAGAYRGGRPPTTCFFFKFYLRTHR